MNLFFVVKFIQIGFLSTNKSNHFWLNILFRANIFQIGHDGMNIEQYILKETTHQ